MPKLLLRIQNIGGVAGNSIKISDLLKVKKEEEAVFGIIILYKKIQSNKVCLKLVNRFSNGMLNKNIYFLNRVSVLFSKK